jgi:FGGY-family pentulose kinase
VSSCTVTCKWTYLAHETQGWQHDLFERIDLGDLPRRAGLPDRPAPIGSVAGPLTAAAASELGLAQHCTVGVGLIDAHAGGVGLIGNLGGDAFDRNVAVIAGTSTCHMAVSAEPRRVPGVWGPYNGAMIPGLWLNEGGQSATGALLDHILDWHAQAASLGPHRHEAVARRAEELLASEGSGFTGELLVLPDFNGNRSPLADATLTGVIYGLTLDSSFDALVRLYYATAVGIVLGTRHVLDALDDAGFRTERLHLTGGHAESTLLVRLYADATNRTVVLPAEDDCVLLGTAIVASAAAGLHPSLTDAARAMIRSGRDIDPDPASRANFDREYRRFRMLIDQRQSLRRLALE